MSLDAAEFHAEVYRVVRLIPHGRVTSYGHVAKLIGMPHHSRHVGQALKCLGADVDPPVPWQRVIASSGTISPRGEGGAQRQRDALEAEDVEVREGRTGDLLVNLDTYGWFPTREDIADE
ncbi:DNA binding methylated-DNA--cysteine S-methyltransferase [Peniophora sp. CONT]|nr:DNA binding methylated-DNA--cysteine S-methyltransferase [Peniophora sp. CONT]